MGLFHVAITLPYRYRHVGRARRHYAAAALRPPKPLRAALSAPLARGLAATFVGPPPPSLRPRRLPSSFAAMIPRSFRYLRPRSRESGARRLSAAGAFFIVGRARRHYAAAALRPPLTPSAPRLRYRYAAALSGERWAPPRRAAAPAFFVLFALATLGSPPSRGACGLRRGGAPAPLPRRVAPTPRERFSFRLRVPLRCAPRRPSVAVWPSRSRARGARSPLSSPPPSRGHGRGGRRARLRGKPPLIAGRAVAATPPFLCGHPPAPPSASGLPRPRFLSLGRGYAARGALRSASGGAVGCPPDHSRPSCSACRATLATPLSRAATARRALSGGLGELAARPFCRGPPWWSPSKSYHLRDAVRATRARRPEAKNT